MLEHESDTALAGAAGERVFAIERHLAGDPASRGPR